MAIKITYEVECDVCHAKKNISEEEYDKRRVNVYAVRETGVLEADGYFNDLYSNLRLKNLDLCCECEKKAYSTIISAVDETAVNEGVCYSFIEEENDSNGE